MFIYILNVLHDGLKKCEHVNNFLAKEIINDAKFISELGGISKNVDYHVLNNKLNNIVKLFCKYNLTFKESVTTLNKLLVNKKNIWILENFYKCDSNSKLDSSCLILSFITHEMLQETRIKRREGLLDCLAL